MTIASCFFCVPTPNTSISESNLHLASSPPFSSRLSSSCFTGAISAKSLSLHRSVSICPVFSASIYHGSSDNIGGGGDGGGGGNGDKNDGGGEGGEDRDRNRDKAMLILAESGTELESLPKDLVVAIEAVGFLDRLSPSS